MPFSCSVKVKLEPKDALKKRAPVIKQEKTITGSTVGDIRQQLRRPIRK
jgi:hypothetical protein